MAGKSETQYCHNPTLVLGHTIERCLTSPVLLNMYILISNNYLLINNYFKYKWTKLS